ncbi:carbamoyl phosphate synthase [Marinithermofilum abyssi]|uniref:Carbamoyl phosphate synthase n=1 Tax=Marinithermofilum abyssi TaxID=1571185 RepID=A0A8J2YE22_9BACL|nr:ATP-grasp domain-containing protein [Marinithermofilum abyssi]GGE23165.1 carbamoyl phosphate synthase [Marinithermofilum abyssi]
MLKPMTVLLTGVGSPGAPGVIKSLRAVKEYDFRIIGIDMNPHAVGQVMVDKFFIGPEATDPDFVPKLIRLCSAENVEVILPLVSKELPRFAKNFHRFKEIGTVVSVSEYNRLMQVINKGTLIHTLKKKGIPTPRSVIVNTVEGLRKALHDLGYPDHPVCFKPVVSDGSRGFRILDTRKNRLDPLFNEKPNSAYISDHELFRILSDCSVIPETIVMEYLPGEEYSIDLLARDGEVIIAIPRLREAIVNGISVKSTIVKEDDVIAYASRIVRELRLHGNIGVQICRDKDTQPKIIEINPRIQGTIVHCTAAGVNLPYLAVKLAKEIPIHSSELCVQWGTRMTRYWEEVFWSEAGQPIQSGI